MTLPLSDILVLDMSRVVAGPSATQTLGDLGANVVKVERRIQGDDQRLVGPPWMSGPNGEPLEEATYFQAVNRNKRSITVDYTKKEGADLLRDMAAKADVFFENYRTGTLAKYGLSYEDIKAINPRIVYCSLTGFGQTGPYSNRSGYDLLVQGMGGMMSINGLADGEPGAGPMRVGIPLADIFAGMNATMGVLAALRHRDKTGRGQYLDIALLDSQIAAMLNPFAAWFNAGVNLPRTGNHHPSAAPYGVYRASDGYILIATFNDREFARLAEAIGRAHWLKDPRYARSGARVENRSSMMSFLGGGATDVGALTAFAGEASPGRCTVEKRSMRDPVDGDAS